MKLMSSVLRVQVATLVVLAMVGVMVVGGVKADDKCTSEVDQLISSCSNIVQGGTPSSECCGLIRSADFKCVCSKVTPQIASLLDVNKIAKAIRGCGRSLPHHSKCGSITLP